MEKKLRTEIVLFNFIFQVSNIEKVPTNVVSQFPLDKYRSNFYHF